jgi:hypothetical protein
MTQCHRRTQMLLTIRLDLAITDSARRTFGRLCVLSSRGTIPGKPRSGPVGTEQGIQMAASDQSSSRLPYRDGNRLNFIAPSRALYDQLRGFGISC